MSVRFNAVLACCRGFLQGNVVEAGVTSCVTFYHVTVPTPGGVEQWDVRVIVFCKQIGGRLLTNTLQKAGQDGAKLHQTVVLVLQ